MSRRRARPRAQALAGLSIAVLLLAATAFAFSRNGESGDDGGGEIVLTGPADLDAAPAATTTSAAAAENRPASESRRRLQRALDSAVGEAAALGGAVEAAVVLDGGTTLVAAEPGEPERAMRAWSMSKVLTAIALLRAQGWGERPGRSLSSEAEEAMTGALVRSENCRQRRMVLELQQAAGGTPADALAALADTAGIAGASIEMVEAPERPEPICHPFLETQRQIADPLAPGLLLGTSTWTVASAARLAYALGDGRYGAALTERLLALLREPKLPSRESPAGDYTAALDWGAGSALVDLQPAYKAGWGGTLQGQFLVGQLAVVQMPGGGVAGIAVAFHPDTQPPKDDPGLTAGPTAVETVMAAVGAQLETASTRR